ncbi:MAG: NF038143 family protein [Desulfobacterales bacterium]|nr:MAG: NF038143 family protein [Desulfobacterales bacterium]
MKKKYELILAREQTLANSVAVQAIKPKPFSVWEVLVPVIFVLGYMRAKESRTLFAQNLLFTKKLALEAAFAVLKKEQSREAVMTGVRSQTASLLSTVPGGVYSDEIRQEQLKEIDLLIDHYCRLMRAEGRDYAALVINAYQTQEDYRAFHEKLKSAEFSVTEAARRTLGEQADAGMAARIEAAADRFRRAEIEKIFNSN